MREFGRINDGISRCGDTAILVSYLRKGQAAGVDGDKQRSAKSPIQV